LDRGGDVGEFLFWWGSNFGRESGKWQHTWHATTEQVWRVEMRFQNLFASRNALRKFGSAEKVALCAEPQDLRAG
jgi:hypothetical protein